MNVQKARFKAFNFARNINRAAQYALKKINSNYTPKGWRAKSEGGGGGGTDRSIAKASGKSI
jgi:hypothetical protein